MTEISSIQIHGAIKSIGPIDFADPRPLRDLPFPSPLPIPEERFTVISNKNTVDKFQYMGRFFFYGYSGSDAGP
jgi:hypothetical protein